MAFNNDAQEYMSEKPFADTNPMHISSNLTIDLNADLGEGMSGDSEMLTLITSANIAGGGHAGGGEILSQTVRLAHENKIAIGAHPSYPDREHFGRTSMRGESYGLSALKDSIREQIVLVAIEAFTVGDVLSHVKAHGALYNDSMVHQDSSDLFLDSLLEAEMILYAQGYLLKERIGLIPVFGLPKSVLMESCSKIGRPFFAEAFADRAYTAEGLLTPRSQKGSVLESTEEVLKQALQIVTTNTVESIDGVTVTLSAETLCVHGDTPGAIEMAEEIRKSMNSKGITIKRLSAQ